MKVLILALILFPSVIFADSGVSMSYRSIPAYAKGDDGITHFRTIETGMLSFYLDDTLKGHSKTKGGYYVTKFYVRVYEDPSEKHPVGRMVEQEVDIGDAQTVEEINMRNAWKKTTDRVSKVYAKQVWVPAKVKGVLPSWSNPNRGAGYTLSLNFVFGSLERKVDIYGIDLLIGKRLFVIPHLFHIYGKMGPSIMGENWNTPWGYADVNVGLGAVISGGMQIQVLKGIKFFTEAEFRGYGPVLRNETSASVTLVNKLPLTEKEVQDYYREYEPNQGKASAKGLVRESLRFGVRFTF